MERYYIARSLWSSRRGEIKNKIQRHIPNTFFHPPTTSQMLFIILKLPSKYPWNISPIFFITLEADPKCLSWSLKHFPNTFCDPQNTSQMLFATLETPPKCFLSPLKHISNGSRVPCTWGHSCRQVQGWGTRPIWTEMYSWGLHKSISRENGIFPRAHFEISCFFTLGGDPSQY